MPYILHDSDMTVVPAGHLRRSRGFKKKVLDNPVMNKDHRSIGLVSTTDGVPFFDDQKRGAWPFILRIGNLPDGLSHHISNTHLHLLQPSEFWEVDTDANVLRRRVRAPKNLQPYLSIIADDLHAAYHRGSSLVSLPFLAPIHTEPRFFSFVFINMSFVAFCSFRIRSFRLGAFQLATTAHTMHRHQGHGCKHPARRTRPQVPVPLLPALLDG